MISALRAVIPSHVILCHHADSLANGVHTALGYWVKEGVGLVVHFPLGDVAKILRDRDRDRDPVSGYKVLCGDSDCTVIRGRVSDY